MSLQYLSGTATTCLVLEGGDIVTVQEDQLSSDSVHIEIMGSIDAGITASRWSPDEELLAVVTKADTLVFMSSTFDPMSEINLTPDDLKASKHVSVGWGKKETQFQGRGAKALRDPTIPERVDEGLPSSNEDGSTTISWRGDGAFLAINSAQGTSRRVVRVYSREGELDSASEPVDGLEGALSWRPSGNLIAGIQRRADRIDVVFFERNGLRHGEFTLRSPAGALAPEDTRIKLEWNSDSTVLAVLLKDVIQLWTTGNYHWYLKQEIPLGAGVSGFTWHSEKSLRFSAFSSNSVVLSEHIFYTARGSCRPPHDHGAVAVIDGDTVKFTPFRIANVPPPMCRSEIEVASSIIDVAFGHASGLLAILHHKGIDLYQCPVKNGRVGEPVEMAKLPFEAANASEYHIPLRVCFTSENTVRCMSFQNDTFQHSQVGIKEATQFSLLKRSVNLVATSTYNDDSLIESYGQDTTGKLYRLSSSEDELLPVHFTAQLPWFEVTKVDGVPVAFGLSRGGHIYANSRSLAKNCTSFIITPSHLIFTTSNHLVKYVHLTADVEGMRNTIFFPS